MKRIPEHLRLVFLADDRHVILIFLVVVHQEVVLLLVVLKTSVHHLWIGNVLSLVVAVPRFQDDPVVEAILLQDLMLLVDS